MPSPVTLLTPELQAEICRLIKAGNRNEVAAIASGVPQKTYETWVTNGNKGIEPYAAFLEASGAARAHAEVNMMKAQLAGDPFKGNNTGTSAFNWLKTSRAKHYAEEKRITVEVESVIQGFLEVMQDLLTTDQYVEILTTWQDRRDGGKARGGELRSAQAANQPKLLRAADVVDTEGKPSL